MDSRAGRFIRRHNGNRLATRESEMTLVHIVSRFALEVARDAAAGRSGASGASIEEGDVRKAVSRMLHFHDSALAAKAGKPQPLHPCLLES